MKYQYCVELNSGESSWQMLFETDEIATPAVRFTLSQNRPNPFNSSTMIEYYLPEAAPAKLAVYDVQGRLIIKLVEATRQDQGRHVATWNGRDANGQAASSGVYFYRLTARKMQESKKMILVR